jgi:hypothetical protein
MNGVEINVDTLLFGNDFLSDGSPKAKQSHHYLAAEFLKYAQYDYQHIMCIFYVLLGYI